jgi:peroxidase
VPLPPNPVKLGNLQHLCGCANAVFDFTPTGAQQIRNVLSDRFSSGGSAILSTVRWSDHVWSFGQFMDHDLVTTSNTAEPTFPVTIKTRLKTAPNPMLLTRLLVNPDAGNGTCRAPMMFNTPLIDGGMIYGHDASYLKV